MKERLAAVREHVRPGIMPLTEDEASGHLKRRYSCPIGPLTFRGRRSTVKYESGISQAKALVEYDPRFQKTVCQQDPCLIAYVGKVGHRKVDEEQAVQDRSPGNRPRHRVRGPAR